MSKRNIFIAFILNLFFSIFELFGGLFTGSIAILSDSLHDFFDAMGIGAMYLFEKKSERKPDEKYTYGYMRFSLISAFFLTLLLTFESAIVLYISIKRLINPTPVNYQGMIWISVFGIIVNFLAAYVTHGKGSMGQKAVNLHMLEDVLGWVVIFIGSILMNFTNISLIDPIMSIVVTSYIIFEASKTLLSTINVFLLKLPKDVNINEIKEHVTSIHGVNDAHHIHIWSIDGNNNYATLHVSVNQYSQDLKKQIKEELKEHGIVHSTIEFEIGDESCDDIECNYKDIVIHNHNHHHHHH